MAKKKPAKKKAKKAKRPAKLKGPRPGDKPPRTAWYLAPIGTTCMDEGEFLCVTLFDANDLPVATVYGDEEPVVLSRAQKAFAALVPKGK